MSVRRSLAAVGWLSAVLLLLAACSGSKGPDFTIVSGSENQILQPLVMRFCEERRASCTMRYEGSLDIGLSLEQGDIDADAVWPASSVWIDMFDTDRRVKSLTSIARMPVILGVRQSKAEALGWIGKPVAMDDILAAVRGGSLRFLMTSATQSNSGASAFLAMLASAIGKKGVVEPGDLDDPAVRDKVRMLLSGVARSAGSSGWLADLYVESAARKAPFDAMWNYEAVLKETNDKLRAAGDELLYAVTPTDGVAMADSPLSFIDRGRGEAVEAFFRDLQTHLLSPEIAAEITKTGRRTAIAGTGTTAPEPDWNFDPSHFVTVIPMPEPRVIKSALQLYQEVLRRPSLTALCLDFSGSMTGSGETQLKEATRFLFTPEQAAKVLVQWTPQDRIIVIPFDGKTRQAATGTGSLADQARLLAAVDANTANGGTDMYACARQALDAFGPSPDDTALPAIVLMTDGKSDGDPQDFVEEWRRRGSRVPIFGITFGLADRSQLDTIATATSGRVFDGTTDLVGAFRAARGYN